MRREAREQEEEGGWEGLGAGDVAGAVASGWALGVLGEPEAKVGEVSAMPTLDAGRYHPPHLHPTHSTAYTTLCSSSVPPLLLPVLLHHET